MGEFDHYNMPRRKLMRVKYANAKRPRYVIAKLSASQKSYNFRAPKTGDIDYIYWRQGPDIIEHYNVTTITFWRELVTIWIRR